MRHRVKTVKLGRTGSQRDALLRSLVCSLIESRRIKTTLPKARAARSLAEKMVTLGKAETLAARRKAIATLHQKDKVRVLFDEIAPGFKQRAGGYTRILKIGKRSSDGAEMALLEWVENDELAATQTKAKKKSAPAKDVAPAQKPVTESETSAVEATPATEEEVSENSPEETPRDAASDESSSDK